jgi:hypothetical protein
METIHLKTVDPVSQALLQSAAARGLDLNWERYEKLQPQDGFLRAGLSCPFGCLQGPCRIDPFGRGADRGICGLDRDRMVAALLLRLCLNGVLEALSGLPGNNKFRLPAWPGSLESRAVRALENLGGGELALNEVYQSAARLHRPGDTAEELIRCCLRLGMLTLALMDTHQTAQPKEDKIACRVGYGLLAADNPIIGICGQPSTEFLAGLVSAAAADKPGVGLVSLGDWIAVESGYLPIACTSGEAELLLSSGRISLLVCGSGTDPSLPALCNKLEIPLILTHEAPEPLKTVRLAVASHDSHAKTDFFQDGPPVEETQILMNAEALQTALKKDRQAGWVLMGGADALQQSLGWIATEVAPVLAGAGLRVASWGDAALWMVKRGLTRDDNEHPVRLLSPRRGPFEALKAIAASDAFDSLKGVCYTGLNSCRDLTVAMGLAMLGARVCIGTPLPLWGSKKVCDGLAALFEGCRGEFSHFDHPAEASEILSFFQDCAREK